MKVNLFHRNMAAKALFFYSLSFKRFYFRRYICSKITFAASVHP